MQQWYLELFKLNGSNKIASIEERHPLVRADQPTRQQVELAMREVEWERLRMSGIHGMRIIAEDGTVYLDWDVWDTLKTMSDLGRFEYRQSLRKDEQKDP
jgi:hypothetical protein